MKNNVFDILRGCGLTESVKNFDFGSLMKNVKL
jgi:hypothetical protein